MFSLFTVDLKEPENIIRKNTLSHCIFNYRYMHCISNSFHRTQNFSNKKSFTTTVTRDLYFALQTTIPTTSILVLLSFFYQDVLIIKRFAFSFHAYLYLIILKKLSLLSCVSLSLPAATAHAPYRSRGEGFCHPEEGCRQPDAWSWFSRSGGVFREVN